MIRIGIGQEHSSGRRFGDIADPSTDTESDADEKRASANGPPPVTARDS
jgi:hypothetical protein